MHIESLNKYKCNIWSCWKRTATNSCIDGGKPYQSLRNIIHAESCFHLTPAPFKDSWHGNTGDSKKSRQDPLHQLIFLFRSGNRSTEVWFLLYNLINSHARGTALDKVMPITVRKNCLLGSGVSKCEKATGLILPGQTDCSVREMPCLHLSTWFNSWLWLKIHDCVLVVAEGTL